MKKLCRAMILAVLVVLCTGLSVETSAAGKNFVKAKKITNEVLDSLKLDGYDNLMIVAHPDDETLWGGGHLLKENYLVVCLTNAKTYQYGDQRANELKKALKKTGDKGIIMYYPDYRGRSAVRDNWDSSKKNIKKDMEKLLSYKNWKKVVTHNKRGEYGHAHHKMTNQIVTSGFKKVKPKGSTLYYFGNYYKKGALNSLKKKPSRLSKKSIREKTKVLGVYKSQASSTKVWFVHMVPYEDWKTAISYASRE